VRHQALPRVICGRFNLHRQRSHA